MTPLRRITRPMFRYGEADFDEDYLRWGFHDHDTQISEAESVLTILGSASPLRILDLACGCGAHAIHWAKKGHMVTAVDLSETFVRQGREAADKEGVQVQFLVADIVGLDLHDEFDVATWIEPSFFDERAAQTVFRALRYGGRFITDVRNPENPQVRSRSGDWRTWREENGIFYLERHETNAATGNHEDAWITIDPQSDVIDERVSVGSDTLVKSPDIAHVLRQVGFSEVALKTMDGQDFVHGEEPRWLWLVARK